MWKFVQVGQNSCMIGHISAASACKYTFCAWRFVIRTGENFVFKSGCRILCAFFREWETIISPERLIWRNFISKMGFRNSRLLESWKFYYFCNFSASNYFLRTFRYLYILPHSKGTNHQGLQPCRWNLLFWTDCKSNMQHKYTLTLLSNMVWVFSGWSFSLSSNPNRSFETAHFLNASALLLSTNRP